jgi:hypothetical protein
VALSRPTDHDLPFSTWSLARLAEFLVAEGVVDDLSHEGLRVLLREEGMSFQRLKTWKQSHREQASMIRRYISWRNRHARDQRLGRIVMRANVA